MGEADADWNIWRACLCWFPDIGQFNVEYWCPHSIHTCEYEHVCKLYKCIELDQKVLKLKKNCFSQQINNTKLWIYCCSCLYGVIAILSLNCSILLLPYLSSCLCSNFMHLFFKKILIYVTVHSSKYSHVN